VNPPRHYHVSLGVFGTTNPGTMAIAMVTRLGGAPHEDVWSRVLPRTWSAFHAGARLLAEALRRVDRPDDAVRICLRDLALVQAVATARAAHAPAFLRPHEDPSSKDALLREIAARLHARPNTSLEWRGHASQDPDVAHACEIARLALASATRATSR